MFEEWLISFEDKNPRYISKKISQKEFSIELAYHEASHLVFQRLIYKLNLGFNEPINIFIDSKNEQNAGYVHGFGASGLVYNSRLVDENDIKAFYTDKKERLFSDCLQYLSGNTSYKAFIDSTTEYYISNSDINMSEYKMKMYKLDTVPNHQHGVDDYFKVKNRLQYIDVSDKQSVYSFYQKITNDVLEIMDIRAVELSIRYVKNHLLRNDGKLIQGKYFQEIKEFVDELIKNVSIKPFLSKYLEKLEQIE